MELKCYFIVEVYFNEGQRTNEYDEYIKQVKPIVESYGGKYLVRTEEIFSLSENRKPDRVIVIQFIDRRHLDTCFASEEYQKIKSKRENFVDARAIIVEGEDVSV